MMNDDLGMSDTREFESIVVPDNPLPTVGFCHADFAARSHRGKLRPNNEDHYLIGQVCRSMAIQDTNLPLDRLPSLPDEVGYVLAIADGMGGMAFGEEASQLAIVTGLELVRDAGKWDLHCDDPAEIDELMAKFRSYFEQVNQAVVLRASHSDQYAGMGTTLTVAYGIGCRLFVVHAGDSRAYLFHNGKLQQITRDHTLAQELARRGHIDQEQVKTHRYRSVLTNYIGTSGHGINVEIHQLDMTQGDRLLLCTDGLSDMVDDHQIEAVLATATTSEQACDALIDLSLNAGGRDNITVLVASYSSGS